MKNINPALVEKYFRKECTPEEAKHVLAWLRTPEGMRYLEKHIEDYNDRVRNTASLSSILSEPVDSKRIFSGIQDRIDDKTRASQRDRQETSQISSEPKISRNQKKFQHIHRSVILLKVVAAVLVMVLAGGGAWWLEQQRPMEDSGEPTAKEHATEHEQQKLLTLSDGTTVRLNENSSLTIPENYNQDTRRVELIGEAFFDVEHNSAQPFEVKADEGFIRVLGTRFNVKIDPKRRVQVAVLEGKVALSGEDDSENSFAVLSKGYFGVYNVSALETTIEEGLVENYTSWINGELVFEDTPLWQISRQLEWIYGSSFRYTNNEIRELRLFASLPKDDLEEVLSIIASTLGIDYRMDGDEVVWKTL